MSFFDKLFGKGKVSQEAAAQAASPKSGVLVERQTFTVGQEAVIEGPAPEGSFSAVFEDDGETAYFYALDMRSEEQPIQDAVHIYNVQQVSDRNVPSRAEIVWSADSNRVLLLINNYPHAAFDFRARLGLCRNGFPPAGQNSGWTRAKWDDAVMAWFE